METRVLIFLQIYPKTYKINALKNEFPLNLFILFGYLRMFYGCFHN
nr:MAG TPA: hypothetical protein [Caudoviricetes sp.]DAS96059.1 MAG TPA: hypothetical protein [Caudoviricetes sp.]